MSEFKDLLNIFFEDIGRRLKTLKFNSSFLGYVQKFRDVVQILNSSIIFTVTQLLNKPR